MKSYSAEQTKEMIKSLKLLNWVEVIKITSITPITQSFYKVNIKVIGKKINDHTKYRNKMFSTTLNQENLDDLQHNI